MANAAAPSKPAADARAADARTGAGAAASRGLADAPEDPRQLLAQLDVVQREIQRAERRLEALESLVADAQRAASTLKALAAAAQEQDVLLPVGAGVHVRARVDPKHPALVPIGAGYATEGPVGQAAEALEKRVAAASRSFQDAVQDAERLSQAAAALNERLEALSQAGPDAGHAADMV